MQDGRSPEITAGLDAWREGRRPFAPDGLMPRAAIRIAPYDPSWVQSSSGHVVRRADAALIATHLVRRVRACVRTATAWETPRARYVRVGPYWVSGVDANGTASIGCQHYSASEIEWLAAELRRDAAGECRRSPTYLRTLDEMLGAYIECALWSSTDNSDAAGGQPMDNSYSSADITSATLGQMRGDCATFLDIHWDDISMDIERAGHDFWLTRNDHGAGFWDGGWEQETGERLTRTSKLFRATDLYVGPRGKIYAD